MSGKNAAENQAEDAALVESAKAKPALFGLIYRKYWDPVYRFFWYRLKDIEQTSDFAQETFLKAFKSLNSFRHRGSSYLSYLRKIARNVLIDHFRRKKTHPLEEAELVVDPKTSDPDELVDAKILWSKLDQLSPEDRRVVYMYYRDNKRLKEIATELGRTENAVKLLLSRARKKLRHLEKS